jgi:6-phosphogluconolactonase/glucosamine-6-phosphate isomerase/deaminase
MTKELTAGKVKIYIEKTEDDMGKRSADMAALALKQAVSAGKKPVLWLMAAPSGFAFYKAFVELCRSDKVLATLMKKTLFFQFDDYPVGRADPKFPITFRALLETYFFEPLQKVCGPLDGIRLMELKGDTNDDKAAAEYAAGLDTLLEDPTYYVIQLKGIGMDGHWGFHGSDTPLTEAPKIIKIPMKGQNIHQQKIDWPQYFKTDADVPKHAYSFTVSAFLKAHYIIDNVPQASKEFSVLACYGNDLVLNDVPSSALKNHDNAAAVLTEKSARALLDYRGGVEKRGETHLLPETRARLEALWKEPGNPAAEKENTAGMNRVLKKLGFIE